MQTLHVTSAVERKLGQRLKQQAGTGQPGQRSMSAGAAAGASLAVNTYKVSHAHAVDINLCCCDFQTSKVMHAQSVA